MSNVGLGVVSVGMYNISVPSLAEVKCSRSWQLNTIPPAWPALSSLPVCTYGEYS